MFEGPFREGEEQSTTLEEINGVVTPQSFQMLIQWVCLGRVVFRECAPDLAITMAIEFARLADMCRITGMESLMGISKLSFYQIQLQRTRRDLVGERQIRTLIASRPSTLFQQSLCLNGIQCVRY